MSAEPSPSPAAGPEWDRAVPVVPGARSLARRTIRPLLRAWLSLTVEDEHLVPSDGPVLIASTHQSHADSMALGAGLQRPVYFLGDERLTQWPLLGSWLPKLGMIPVRRGTGDADALRHIAGLLDAGQVVVVYPEGTRSRDGRVYRPRSGVARLAAQTGVPVVPAAVTGIFEVWPIGQRPRWRGGEVTVRFGAPLQAPAADPRARRRFNEALHSALVTLSGAEPADVFAPVGGGGEAAP